MVCSRIGTTSAFRVGAVRIDRRRIVALVTYTDSTGRPWRVWDVARMSIGSGRTEFLEPEYRDGWLCFESDDEGERLRLAEFPKNWATLPPDRLDLLRRLAKPVTRRTPPAGAPTIESSRGAEGGDRPPEATR